MNKVDLEEKKYEKLRKLGQELHIPIPEAFWEFEVTDKDGKVIQRHKQRSHSWVRNAYNLLLSQMASKAISDTGVFGAGLLSIKRTNGLIDSSPSYTATISMELSTYGYRAAAASNVHGIQVGSGANAESFEDYVLQTLIAEGTGGGQLNHIAMAAPTKSYDVPTLTQTVTWIRYMNNNSAGNVSVNEVALTTFSTGPIYWVMSRDKLGATVTIPATGQLKITYVISLSYPS